MIDSTELKNRYRQKDEVIDARDRVITVVRLKLSQQSQLYEMIEKPINRVMYSVAASVRKINDASQGDLIFTFPSNQEQVLSVLDALDQEGFEAASKAYRKINGIAEEDGKPPSEEELDAALS